MSKETKTIILFFIISFILVSVFSVFYWFNSKGNLENLEHIGHPDWSNPSKIAAKIHSYNFSLIPVKDNFNIFYLTKNSKNKNETLFTKKFDYKGNIISEQKLLEEKSLNDFKVFKNNNSIHLYAIMGPDDSKQSLQYFRFDSDFNIIEKENISDDLNYAYGLDLSFYNNKTYLAYNTMEADSYKIELLKYDWVKNEVFAKNRLQGYNDAKLPRIKTHNDELYLAFLKLNHEKSYQVGKKSTVNKYNLMLQKFDFNLVGKNKIKKLDSAYLKDERSKPEFKFINSQKDLLVFYQKFNELDQNLLLNKIKYNLRENVVVENEEVGENISDIDLVNSNGKYSTVFNRQNQRNSLLLLNEFSNTDFEKINGQRLFSKNKLSYVPSLFKLNENLHLAWVELENGNNNIYYANNLYPKKPGFFEIIGLEFNENKMNYLTGPLYFLSMPILAIFTKMHILAIAVITLALFYFLGKKFDNKILKIINKNIYVSFSVGVLSIIIAMFLFLDFKILFYPGKPPLDMVSYIFMAAFIGVLAMLKIFKTNSSQALLIGAGGVALWIYWLAQINMLFHAYKYFY